MVHDVTAAAGNIDFNVTWNLNGSELYTGEAPHEYSTSIIGNYTVNFLHDVANGLGNDLICICKLLAVVIDFVAMVCAH